MPSPSTPLHLHPLSRFATVLGVFVTKEQRGIVGKAGVGLVGGGVGGVVEARWRRAQQLLRPRHNTRNPLKSFGDDVLSSDRGIHFSLCVLRSENPAATEEGRGAPAPHRPNLCLMSSPPAARLTSGKKNSAAPHRRRLLL